MKIAKNLSADRLFALSRRKFKQIPEHRPKNVRIPLEDALMSALAMFSLKEPALLHFEKHVARNENLKSIYGIGQVPSDTQMRTILDEIEPGYIRPLFKTVVKELERGKVLQDMAFLDGHYLLSIDGTGYFQSKSVHCENCLERVNRKTGEVTYSHQMMGAALVHPNQKPVVPLSPEPIMRQDGETKNDCERNAVKRLLAQIREDHPHRKFIVVEDALAANGPHLRELKHHNMRYIIGVKPGDHAFLFEKVQQAHENGQTTELEIKQEKVTHRFRWVNQMPLNASHPDLLVNFLEYWEVGPKRTRHFTWITDWTLDARTVYPIMRGGRARWKIENETFNTLKNQGYQFEHNFGHGYHHLSTVFAMLMMLAFAIDQAQQLGCALFQAALEKLGSKKGLWREIRSFFDRLTVSSMTDILRGLVYGYQVEGLVIFGPP